VFLWRNDGDHDPISCRRSIPKAQAYMARPIPHGRHFCIIVGSFYSRFATSRYGTGRLDYHDLLKHKIQVRIWGVMAADIIGSWLDHLRPSATTAIYGVEKYGDGRRTH